MVMSGTQSWNKLFEREYLPNLVEKENYVDPITGTLLIMINNNIIIHSKHHFSSSFYSF